MKTHVDNSVKQSYFEVTYKAFAKRVKQHEFTPQDLWLFLSDGYPLSTDIEVKRLEFAHFHWLRAWGENFEPITKKWKTR